MTNPPGEGTPAERPDEPRPREQPPQEQPPQEQPGATPSGEQPSHEPPGATAGEQPPTYQPPGASGSSEYEPGYWERQAEQQGQQQAQVPYPPYQSQEQGQVPYPPYQGQPYPQPGYPGQVQYAPDHPRATMSLVLGILGIVVCGIIAPFAWSVGKKTVNEIDASNGQLGGRGAAQAGYIMGIIGTIFLAIGVLVGVVALVVALIGVSTSTSP